MERRGQAGDRQVDVDASFKLGADCVLEPTPRVVSEQSIEPTSVEADCDDDEVVGDTSRWSSYSIVTTTCRSPASIAAARPASVRNPRE